MKKILYIDATVRKESRTKELTDYLINKIDGEITHLVLKDELMKSLDEETLNWRTECCTNQDFSDSYFDYAKEFKEADIIVIAAPYWDGSFPATLKKYVETISISGLCFKYNDQGIPVSMCKENKLYYVTSAGGPIFNDSYGYGYISDYFKNMFNTKESYLVKAEMLDIYGSDIDSIIHNTKDYIDSIICK